MVGASHVLLGSDYPFDMGNGLPCERLDAMGLSQDQVDLIAGMNAARLLRLVT